MMPGRTLGEEMTKILRFTSAPVAVLLVLLTVITMVSGVTTLFIHYFPAVPPTSTMTTACGAEYLSPNPTTVQEGSSGQISFRCSDANPAFTISGGVFSAMPDFSYYGSFPAPYSTLWIYQSDGGTTTGGCAGRTGARQLTSGVTAADIAPLNYSYCAEYANVGGGGLPAFYVYWTTT